MNDLLICDAQVHAPKVDSAGRVNGIDEEPLLDEMTRAKVARAVIVPLRNKGTWTHNRPSLEIAQRHPNRFAVMGLLDNEIDPASALALGDWRRTPSMLGFRISCYSDPLKTSLLEDGLDFLWRAAEENDVPVMLFAPEGIHKIARIASRHPGLRVIVDHLALLPFVEYDDLMPHLSRLEPLAVHPNIAIKASSIPSSVPGPYPYRVAHEPLMRLLQTFGPSRVFWGSDLTRLPCPYIQSVTMFTEELGFLSDDDKRLVMGQAICDWLRWPWAQD